MSLPEDNKLNPIETNEDSESTIFSAPVSHDDKAPEKSNLFKKLLAAFLALAIVVGGTLAVVKLIPEKEDINAAEDATIPILQIDTDNVEKVTLKNESNDTVLSYALQLFEGPERVLNDIVKFLLAHGVELENRETELGFTPLMLASHKGYSSIVKLLVAHGADVNAASARQKNDSKQTGGKNSPGDNTKRGFPIELITVSVPETPLTLAKTPEIRAYLKEHGAKE